MDHERHKKSKEKTTINKNNKNKKDTDKNNVKSTMETSTIVTNTLDTNTLNNKKIVSIEHCTRNTIHSLNNGKFIDNTFDSRQHDPIQTQQYLISNSEIKLQQLNENNCRMYRNRQRKKHRKQVCSKHHLDDKSPMLANEND